MNASQRQKPVAINSRAPRQFSMALRTGTLIAIEDLPLEFTQHAPRHCAFETIGGRVYVRVAEERKK